MADCRWRRQHRGMKRRLDAAYKLLFSTREIVRDLVTGFIADPWLGGLDLDTLAVARAGQPLHLYPASRKLLEVLMQASPAAVTRERLEQALYGDDPPDGDMLRSHIYELRRVVDGPFPVKLIHTLPRTGYRLGTTDRGNGDGS